MMRDADINSVHRQYDDPQGLNTEDQKDSCGPHSAPSTGYVQIGKFVISSFSVRSVWIHIAGDGEGGAFDIDKLEKVLQKFYEREF